MDFTFSEEQRMMAASFRELAQEVCSGERLRALYDGSAPAAGADCWSRLAELGLFSVLAPEAQGGMGLDDRDFVLLAEEAGLCALPEPLCEQAGVAVPLLAELAVQTGCGELAQTLTAAAAGEIRIGVAHVVNPFALAPTGLTHWLLCEPGAVRLLAAAQVQAVAEPSVDAGRRLFRLNPPAGRGGLLAAGELAATVVERAAQRGALYSAAQALGATQRMIDIAVAYARERVQFGKPIGSYQAIKHHLASVQVKLEFARPVVYAAVTRVAETGAHSRAAISHAALAAADAADLAARTAIQVHGAMGYSWEVDLHFYMKRAWGLAGSWGSRSLHARRVQSLIGGGDLALGPEHTFEL